jgi:hypothetical protein
MSFPFQVGLPVREVVCPRRCIRSAELILANTHNSAEIMSALVIFSLRATAETMAERVEEGVAVFISILTVAGITNSAIPSEVMIDPDNHTIEHSLSNWNIDDLLKFGAALEMTAKNADWGFTPNLNALDDFKQTFRGSLSC